MESYIKKFMGHFSGCSIIASNEMIVERKNNIYFSLNGVESEYDLQKKAIVWLCRSAFKGVKPNVQSFIRSGLNKYFGVDFSAENYELIYTNIGCGVDNALADKFLQSGLNLDVLRNIEK